MGSWTRIDAPGELAKLDYAADGTSDVRVRIQSIPTPWARLVLFKNALEDTAHPARALVTTEILDALEFLWGAGSAHIAVLTVRLEDLQRLGTSSGSARVEDFAAALVELAPRQVTSAGGRAPLKGLRIITVDNRPILASSPYSLLFTAEDAAGEHTGPYFKFLQTKEPRPLSSRPEEFQRYIAQVILPQLTSAASRDENTDPAFAQRFLRPWLEEELKTVRRTQRSPTDEGDRTDWRENAERLGLEPFDSTPLGGLLLFKQKPGAKISRSRWRLRSPRNTERLPLVIDPKSFDGRLYEGAHSVQLPANLAHESRETLPGIGTRYPWVNPETDWLTDEILLLNQPLAREAVKGLHGYRSLRPADPRFSVPRLLLPLRAEFFKYYSADDVNRVLSIDVDPSGSITVKLTLEIGPDDGAQPLVIQRTYREANIRRETGPELVVWPAFRDDRWSSYSVLRRDANPNVADYYEIRAINEGTPLVTESERRTPLVRILALRQAPEALEVVRIGVGTEPAASLGVVIPNYRRPEPLTQTRWAVGIDFGTSNTVVSVRKDNAPAASIFNAEALTLPLTEPAEGTNDIIAAYFYPWQIEPRPFGTAVVHLKNLRTLVLEDDRVGLRVNIPFSGHVDGYEFNRVQGDLKWSAEQNAYYLTTSFLRHLLAAILAEAVEKGISPERITIHWSYPRAFSSPQVTQLDDMWRRVAQQFAATGLRPESVASRNAVRSQQPIDESRCVLRHFFNAGKVGPAGGLSVIVDVGGGTSDIAAYGNGRALILDSIMFGGRNLTGLRMQAVAAQQLRNPFVQALVVWAEHNGLEGEPLSTVRMYRDNGQEHLAFSYLIATEWFARNRARFTAENAYRAFQAVVLYFFGALFYYVGLSLRSIHSGEGDLPRLPEVIMLGGNGSRYVEWLTDFAPLSASHPLRDAFSALIGKGAAAATRPVGIELSSTPKEEVARGLVAAVAVDHLHEDDAANTAVVGEAISARLGATLSERSFAPGDRFGVDDVFGAEQLGSIRWASGALEIERFHSALLEAAQGLTKRSKGWTDIEQALRRSLAGLDRESVRTQALNRLQYLIGAQESFAGSLFVLEATVVLERILESLHAGNG